MAEVQPPATQPPATQPDDPFVTRKATLIATGLAIACVVIPFWFWMDTWFGRQLSDEQITAYLADTDSPRKAQHALAQISNRLTAGDQTAQKWYPQIIDLTTHELPELRLTAAWLMGDDTANEDFHQALLRMLDDEEALVRRNAALALSKFGDPAGLPEIRSMLKPFHVTTDYAGVVTNRLVPGDIFDENALLVRVQPEGEQEAHDIRSPLPGILETQLHKDGDRVGPGQQVSLVRPESTHLLQGLLGLYLIGTEEDIDLIRPYQRTMEGLEPTVAPQAAATIEKIRNR